jgi:hypothetical protein
VKKRTCPVQLAIPTPFHGIPWTIFWLATQPFFYSIPSMGSMEFPMNLYYKSMYYSTRIPWNSPHGIPWKDTNQCVVKYSTNVKN